MKESPAIAMLRPIQGPGICGADFPLKVVALGENEPMGYAQELRPPGSVPQASAPASTPYPRGATSQPLPSPSRAASYPSYSTPPYARPGYDVGSAPVASRSAPISLDPQQSGGPNSPTYYPSIEREPLDPPGPYEPDRIYEPERTTYPRDDGYDDPRQSYPPRIPQQRAPYSRPAADAPYTTAPAPSPRMTPVPLGPARRPIQATATVTPAATLACPIVSALDNWIKDAVQPAANRWFSQPVVEIRQISAYSCRGMNGQPGARISEHAFGNALDISAFVLADGRKVTVKNGWRGTPEEQGFLRDIQAAACDVFTTVLAPGSNAFHYDHIHVDLMRRSSGRRICQPGAVSGEEIAARAARNAPAMARHQSPYERRVPRHDLIEPDRDPFAYRGPRDGTTGSIGGSQSKGKPVRPARGQEPMDDEHILHFD